MEFCLLMKDILVYVSCKFEIYIFKVALVISENVRIAFLYVLSIYILSSTANAAFCLNLNKKIRFQLIHLLFGTVVAKPFSEMPCENLT